MHKYTQQSTISTFTYEAAVLADSINAITGDRLTTIMVTIPRVIEKEVLRHRSFSFNSASSRAMRISAVKRSVLSNIYKPTKWLTAQKGMIAADTIQDTTEIDAAFATYLDATMQFIDVLEANNVSKQQANRYLEPFMGLQLIITGSKRAWDVFFAQRISHDADPVINEAAQFIKGVMDNSGPVVLHKDQWHVPFYADNSDNNVVRSCAAIARCSYNLADSVTSLEDDKQLHDKLLRLQHMSVFEHIAYVSDTYTATNGNLASGWVQLRKIYEALNDIAIYRPFR